MKEIAVDPRRYDEIFQKFIRSPLNSPAGTQAVAEAAQRNGIEWTDVDNVTVVYGDMMFSMGTISPPCLILYCLETVHSISVDDVIDLYSM